MDTDLTAKTFMEILNDYQSDIERSKIQKYFKSEDRENDDIFLGVKMGQVFDLAKEFVEMPINEIERLLESPIHEGRVGGVSIMDFQARDKKIPPSRKKELFDLYIRRHDRINSWDLVDRAAPHVVGGYLADKPRDILYQLAKSENVWERRTAIVSTYFFIRKNDLDDTFKIGEMLVHDEHDLIQKAVGGWIREAGKRDPKRLLDFLDAYASSMPRITLRNAIEHLDANERTYYLGLKTRI